MPDQPLPDRTPDPRYLYCNHAELDHGIGICFGTLQCLCKAYKSRERPRETVTDISPCVLPKKQRLCH